MGFRNKKSPFGRFFVMMKHMKFYLSSYEIGNEGKRLQELVSQNNRKVAYISNALDFATDLERRRQGEEKDISDLEDLGFTVELVDLRNYFGNKKGLEKKIRGFGAIWVRGGNVFVLRQAMKLSGFDVLLKNLAGADNNILYGGYSAGICVLAPSLRGLELVDDETQKPYTEQSKIIWDGTGILDYAIVPHYKSDHPESEAVNKLIDYYVEKKIPFKTLKDGEVIIME